jgi:hypothetical protein
MLIDVIKLSAAHRPATSRMCRALVGPVYGKPSGKRLDFGDRSPTGRTGALQ